MQCKTYILAGVGRSAVWMDKREDGNINRKPRMEKEGKETATK